MSGERSGSPGSEVRERLARARRSDPLAPELLNLLAFFAPAPLPADALIHHAGSVPGRLSSDGASAERVRDALRGLVARGALREVDGGILMSHDVQGAARGDLVRPQAAGYADAALRILEELEESAADGEPGPRGGDAVRREVLLPHAPAVAERLVELGRAPDRALVLAARAVEAAGRESAEALEAAERVVRIARESPRLRDPFLVAALLDQVAELRAARDREEAALEAVDEAVERVREACPPDDPRRAVLLHNAGDLTRRLDRPRAAVTLLRECLDLLEGRGEESDPLRARTELDLAEILLAMGEAGEAASAAERAASTCRRSLGARHPETAAAWSLWGRSLGPAGEHAAAAACFRRALEALEETYGPAHPALGPDLGNLAETLEALGRHGRARGLHRRAREVFREAYGPDHRLTRAAERRVGEA